MFFYRNIKAGTKLPTNKEPKIVIVPPVRNIISK